MRIAITGEDGQLGNALTTILAPYHTIIPLNYPTFDLCHPHAIHNVVATNAELVIHPAAYTNVDGCARDPNHAYHINGLGTRYVALACQQLQVPLIYISTNEVFDGTAQRTYYEYDMPAPVNAYGFSKWVGEQAVRDLLTRYYIVRIAWLFGGKHNFVRTVLRLLAEPPATGIRMVNDEVGNPTYSHDVATAIAQLIAQPEPVYGIYHLVNTGACSRYEFACEIARIAGYKDHAGNVPIMPIPLATYQRDSTPPPHTPLHNQAACALGITLRPWQEALAAYVSTLTQ